MIRLLPSLPHIFKAYVSVRHICCVAYPLFNILPETKVLSGVCFNLADIRILPR